MSYCGNFNDCCPPPPIYCCNPCPPRDSNGGCTSQISSIANFCHLGGNDNNSADCKYGYNNRRRNCPDPRFRNECNANCGIPKCPLPPQHLCKPSCGPQNGKNFCCGTIIRPVYKPLPPPVYIDNKPKCPTDNSPAHRLKNVDVQEDFYYYSPSPTADCYKVCNDCGTSECVEVVHCGPGNPVKYSKRQRFSFIDPCGEQDEPNKLIVFDQGPEWPFQDSCCSNEAYDNTSCCHNKAAKHHHHKKKDSSE